MATRLELSEFLASVERRAFKQAQFALRDENVALDIVQDAMLKLTDKYSQRPAEELPLLFQRILQNAIKDSYRRQKVRGLWTTLLSALTGGNDDDDEIDPLEILEVKSNSGLADTPHGRLEQAQVMQIIEHEISQLPPRQREAFLMRYWEEMDIAETASAMGCSEGSVKTHCFRASSTLAKVLSAKGIKLNVDHD